VPHWELAITDLQSLNRAFPTDFAQLKITRRVGSYSELQYELQIDDPNASEMRIATRATKAYRDGVLRFHGTIWDPLVVGSQGIQVSCRDPYAYMAWRRNQAQKTYTGIDAGQIVSDRITIQNALAATRLRLTGGNIQASVNRTRTYNPGMREDEIIQELSNVERGYFFRVDPLDGVAGVQGDLKILYPNAGSTREEVRFEHGPGTVGNVNDFQITYTLPVNRMTASSSNDTGGRISSSKQDNTSIGSYGLFEDEETFSEVTSTTTLGEYATADVVPDPPVAYTLQPNATAPKLFDQFDAGDFVRLRIRRGPIDLFTWVRVTEASLVIDESGVESLAAITVEPLTGAKASDPPELVFRKRIDALRRRQESLERKVENIVIPAPPAPPSTGAGGGVSGDPTYTPPSDPTPPAPPPPPPPSKPPTVVGGQAYGVWYGTMSSPAGQFHAVVNPSGQDTQVYFEVVSHGNTYPAVSLPADNDNHNVDVGPFGSFPRGSTWTVYVHANNASGEGFGAIGTFTAPSVKAQ